MTNPSQPNDPPGFIPPHGGYRELKSFQMSEVVYLLDQQLRQLEQAFLDEGGFTERLYRARQQARQRPNPSYESYTPPPKKSAATQRPPTKP